MTGDCEYIQFPSAFINADYDFMIVSHHGAKTNIKSLKDFGFRDVKKGSPAVVCVGENTNYPHNKHTEIIEELGYKLQETKDLKNFKFKYIF